MMLTRILFIAYEFPPLKVGGVYRPIGFVKYLKSFGYEPIIITLSKRTLERSQSSPLIDEDFGKDERENNIIIEVDSVINNSSENNKLREFFNIYFNPVGIEAKGWEQDFWPKISKAVQDYQPKLIFVTVPPFSILNLAIKASKKFNLPIVTDFRDAWSNWITNPYGSYLHYLIVKKNESKILKNSHAITVTSKQTTDDFIKLNPQIPKEKYSYIPNGYDGNLLEWKNGLGRKKVIKIGYVGSFYYSPITRISMLKPWYKKRGHKILQYTPSKQDWLYRSPFYFFKTLSNLFENNPEFADCIKVEFAGKKPDWIEEMINQFSLQNCISFKGVLSHQDSIAFQREMDLLLITSAKVIGGRDYSIAGKTFEYFQNQKPILAFVCDGAQKDILIESGMAIICDPDDTEKSVQTLKKAIQGNCSLKPNNEFLESLTRQELTKSLANIFNRIIK